MFASGHTVLVIPVPELEWFVRSRWEHYDAAWVSRDPEFTHAHITVLAPYLSDPTPDDLAAVAEIAAITPPFEYRLAEVAEFANGCLHLPPDPAAPFAELIRRLTRTFPQCPPYGGAYDAVPHLTLDQRSPSITPAITRAALGDLPVRARADRLELQWYEEANCHVRHTWLLGGRAGFARDERAGFGGRAGFARDERIRVETTPTHTLTPRAPRD